MENPLVSIIVPVYNVETYLDVCLQSLQKQTYKNIEILLVDDGSTDSSGNICEKYKTLDSRIKLIHQQNQGLSGARNTGLENATGEYLMFVDSDDRVAPQFVEKAVSNLISQQADLLIFNFEWLINDKLTRPIPDYHEKYYKEISLGSESLKALLIADHIPNYVWNKIYKRSLWDGVKFPVGYIYEDIIALMQIVSKVKYITYLPESLYYYRQDNLHSITSFATLKPWNRYCHFKAIAYAYVAAKSLADNERLVSKVLSERMQEAIATIETEYGNPSLQATEIEEVESFIRSNWRNPRISLGTKNYLVGWSILHCKPLAKYYSRRHCERKRRKKLKKLTID